MKIALMGGTGPFGMGLAARWADSHDILLGSRSQDKARSACQKVREMIADPKAKNRVDPYENYHAIERSDVVVPCIDYEYAITTVRELIGGFEDQLVISPLAPMMGSEGGFDYIVPKEGSAALQLVNILPEKVEVVSCLQGVPASKLLDVGRSLNFDVPVFADSGSARKKAFELVRDIRNLKPLYGGPLRLAHIGEMMGILWRNLGALNKMKDPSFKFLE